MTSKTSVNHFLVLTVLLGSCSTTQTSTESATAELSGQACLLGSWEPDLEQFKAYIAPHLDAPNFELSGTLSMHIGEGGQAEYRAENWSILRIFDNKDNLELYVNGVATFTTAAPSRNFYLAETSNTYEQQIIAHRKTYFSPIPTDPIKKMLPMGDWAKGTLTFENDQITFEVTEQDPDGHLIETWYRI